MDAPLPLPAADPLLGAVAPAVTLPVDPALCGDTATPEGFALLLELARLTLEAPATEGDAARAVEEASAEASAPVASSSSPLDGLLFLANVNSAAPVAVPRADTPLPSGPPRATPSAIAPAASETMNGMPAPNAPVEAPAHGAETAQNVVGAVAASMHAARSDPAAPAADVKLQAAASATPPPAGTPAGDAMQSSKPAATDDAPLPAPLDVATSTPHAASEPPPATSVAHSAPASPVATPASHLAAPSSPLATPTIVTIDTPVEQPRFREEVAERIVSFVTRGTERAELKVSPPDLGPVEVRIDLRGGEATLTIVAVQPATRDALESALPLLRDLLAQQGVAFGGATVRDGRAQAEADARNDSSSDGGAGTAAGSEPDETPAARVARAYRLVDIFA